MSGSETWLGIDTATDTAGVSLCRPREVIAEHTWVGRRRHTREVAPAVVACLELAGLEVGQLSGIAVTTGPGSYTGLRIGLSLAKGLALGSGVPLVGVPTLDVLAAALSSGPPDRRVPLWTVLRAGRGRIVAARYPPTPMSDLDGDRPAEWPDPAGLEVRDAENVRSDWTAPAWIAGELPGDWWSEPAPAGIHLVPAEAGVRRSAWLCALGRRWHAARGADDPAELVPTYLGGAP